MLLSLVNACKHKRNEHDEADSCKGHSRKQIFTVHEHENPQTIQVFPSGLLHDLCLRNPEISSGKAFSESYVRSPMALRCLKV